MRETLRKLFSYGLTGGVAAIFDAGGFLLLLHAGLGPVVAGTMSFCVAAVVNYRLTARFVFRQRASWRAFSRFLVGALGGLLVNVGVTTVALLYAGFPPLFAKVMGIGVAFFFNFVINSQIVFARPKPVLVPAPGGDARESEAASPP